MTAPITQADLTAAIRWFATRRPPMPGAAKMYQIARQVLEAHQVVSDSLAPREDFESAENYIGYLLGVVERLELARRNRGDLIDTLERELETRSEQNDAPH